MKPQGDHSEGEMASSVSFRTRIQMLLQKKEYVSVTSYYSAQIIDVMCDVCPESLSLLTYA